MLCKTVGTITRTRGRYECTKIAPAFPTDELQVLSTGRETESTEQQEDLGGQEDSNVSCPSEAAD